MLSGTFVSACNDVCDIGLTLVQSHQNRCCLAGSVFNLERRHHAVENRTSTNGNQHRLVPGGGKRTGVTRDAVSTDR